MFCVPQLPKLVILDRDGVVNEDSDAYIKAPEEWHALPGSLEAIVNLNRAGVLTAIATNQSGVNRGYYDLDCLNRIHQKMLDELSDIGGYLDDIRYCPHLPDAGCDCRKPKPGMLLSLFEHFDITPEDAVFVGDSLSDMVAAEEAGCQRILVRTGKGERSIETDPDLDCAIFPDLQGYVDVLLAVQ